MSHWEEEDELEDELNDLSVADDATPEEDFPALTSAAPASSAVPSSQSAATASSWNKLFKQPSPSLSTPPVQPIHLPLVKQARPLHYLRLSHFCH